MFDYFIYAPRVSKALVPVLDGVLRDYDSRSPIIHSPHLIPQEEIFRGGKSKSVPTTLSENFNLKQKQRKEALFSQVAGWNRENLCQVPMSLLYNVETEQWQPQQRSLRSSKTRISLPKEPGEVKPFWRIYQVNSLRPHAQIGQIWSRSSGWERAFRLLCLILLQDTITPGTKQAMGTYCAARQLNWGVIEESRPIKQIYNSLF